jgi:hypothetical protein
MGDVSELSTFRFSTPMVYLYEALSPIIAYSPVFVATDNGKIKVYSNQYDSAIHERSPCLLGIAQNNAEKGDTVRVICSGVSKVRFYSAGLGLNQDVFVFGQDSRFDDEDSLNPCISSNPPLYCYPLTEDSQVNKYIPGVTCLDNETGITPYIQASGNPIKLGRIPASTIPMTGLTQYASIKIVDILIDLEYG